MLKLNENSENTHLVWLEEDIYYKSDIWRLLEHKYVELLSEKQKEGLYSIATLDFSLCKNINIRNEIKNGCAYILEYKISNIATMFHDKYMLENLMNYINEFHIKETSILNLDVDHLLDCFEEYLIGKGIVTRCTMVRISSKMEEVYYREKTKYLYLTAKIYRINLAAKQRNIKENKKDIWDIRNLDINVMGFNNARPRYTINFEKILQPKIREVVKKYEYERLKTNKYSTIIDDLKALNIFSKYLNEQFPKLETLEQLTREIVMQFLGYIECLDMTHTTKGQRKGSLRVFLNLVVMYGWEFTPKERLLHKEDYTKNVIQLPKPIESNIIKQLNDNIEYLPVEIGRMLLVLQAIGMRANELCQLKVGAVRKDLEGDYFLEYFQSKTERYSRIPITSNIAEVLLKQEEETLSKFNKSKYIFTRDGEKPIGQESVSYNINRLSFERGIKDNTGKLYRFKSHHFRHTVATRYVNSGMNPNMIRIMLGHSKMKSIMSYIELRDSTVIKAMAEVLEEQNKLIGRLNNEVSLTQEEGINLISGICTKSLVNGKCDCIDKCYTCSMFDFTKSDVSNFESYLNIIEENISYTKENGFTRLLEINKLLKREIEEILI